MSTIEKNAPASARSWQGASRLVKPSQIHRSGAWYVAEYRLRNLSKWWAAVLAFGLGNPILYLASVGLGIGALVNRHGAHATPDHVAYLTFLAPALLATAAIQGTQDEVTFPIMHGLKWERVFYGISATAITPKQIAQGVMITAVIRSIFTAGVYWLVLWIAGAFTSANAFLAMPAAMIAGISFACVMLALTVKFIDSQMFLSVIGRFVLTPLFMFSGTFFPLESMPLAARWLGWISPLWHATDLGRFLTYGKSVPGWLLITHVAYLLVLGVVCFTIGSRMLTKKMSS
jgi:lipooligosaccharide transport system permease protein